ncbi:Hypothetical_protein [Hexamita inflata]|uniref:Hypothetical_protein n=1 Tax=Hexamita inflata TaxID=28002 RepID=A0AA86PAR1_9EUKA|nr:Hypothetical protein HINF_LOCUS20484 [Hexamita inflata]
MKLSQLEFNRRFDTILGLVNVFNPHYSKQQLQDNVDLIYIVVTRSVQIRQKAQYILDISNNEMRYFISILKALGSDSVSTRNLEKLSNYKLTAMQNRLSKPEVDSDLPNSD